MSKAIIVLPKAIIAKIEKLELTDYRRNEAYKIMSIIIRNLDRNEVGYFVGVSIPSTYWKKAVNEHYEKSMNSLIENEILFRTPYQWLDGTCRSYFINPELLKGDWEKKEYEDKNKTEYKRETNSLSSECRSTKQFLRKLRLDVCKAKSITDNYIDSGEFMKKIIINPELDEDIVIEARTPYDEKSKHMTAIWWKVIAILNEMELIYDDGKYYVANPDEYIEQKKVNLRGSYYNAIYRFQQRDFYAKRNKTNSRLDSNLTAFPNILFSCLSFSNNKNKEALTSFDLKNSQFMMLAKIIDAGKLNEYIYDHYEIGINKPKTIKYSLLTPITLIGITINWNDHPIYYQNPYNCAVLHPIVESKCASVPIMPEDLMYFMQLAKNGNLYEYIQYEFNLPKGKAGREKAKNMAFEIFFSGAGIRGTKKEMIKIFPTLVLMTERFKKMNGNSSFAIMLQKEESNLFIDVIKKELDKEGLYTATKHDSVICPVSQKDQVEQIVRKILDERLGQYELKTETFPN